MIKLTRSIAIAVAITSAGAVALAANAKCDAVKWTSDEGTFDVCYIESQNSFMSSECENQKCGALKYVEDAKTYVSTEKSPRGWLIDAGSRVCKDLGGKVIITKNARKSENAFCMASDKSVVALSSLTAVNAKARMSAGKK